MIRALKSHFPSSELVFWVFGMANAQNIAMSGAASRFSLAGRVAFVTGAARGIGRACAIALGEAGADVALGLRDRNSMGDVADVIRGFGRRVLPLQMDVTRLDQIKSAIAEAQREFGRVDILVNNVGIGPPNPATSVTEQDFDATLAVNLKGTFFVSQEVGRAMIASGLGGRIINLSSQAGFVALPTESVYCMTKAAISHLTKCLAVEWAAHGINVNAVAPTFITTPGTEKWLADDAFRKDLLSRIPLGHVGQPSDVAGAVVFLASPAAAMITGTTLMIDGGWTAR
jgi:NAD(P)-dependent dehydrogenase (short-subunit alcohol dehydrogenase family)